jgi:superfamily I DNA/RNA helicase
VFAALPTNRRSTEAVVKAGNAIMEGYGTPAKARSDGGRVSVVIVQKNDIADSIAKVIKGYDKNTSFFVLYRTRKLFDHPLSFTERILKSRTGNKNVKVSTIHSVKGDQADVVIIIEDKKGLYPLVHPKLSQKILLGLTHERVILEERRLFYVAATRAVKDLYVLTVGDTGGFVDEMRVQTQA